MSGSIAATALPGHGLGYRETQTYGENLITGRTFPVPAQPGDQASPSISGHLVVWQERHNGRAMITGKDLASGRLFHVADQPGDQATPSISGHIAVWQESHGDQWDYRGLG